MSNISDDTSIKRFHDIDLDDISKRRKMDDDNNQNNDGNDDLESDGACSVSPSRSRSSSYSSSSSSASNSRSSSPLSTHKSKEELKREKIEKDRKNLPIYQYKNKLIELVKANSVIVCIGEAGSGKTTQIPQYLYESGLSKDGMIVITQPRRVAASSVCRRVCEEMNTELGKTVGYTVRFEDHTSEETKIKYMTDGSLVRECLSDPLLSKYNVIMLDEAHERSIHTDILFGFIKKLLNKRKDNIHIIITSATLQTNKFCKYFNNCPCLEIPGRLFPIDIYHNKERTLSRSISNIWKSGVDVAIKIHEVEPIGDILYFLTGQSEIEKACKELKERVKGKNKNGIDLKVLPLYGSLPEEYQRKVFENYGTKTRKIIVSTNIADTSITVPGIKYIIDPGYVKQKIFNPDTGIENLEIVRISQAAAQQRAGRAGRIESGKCYRLYPRIVFEEMSIDTVPEIQRSNLSNVILYLKVLGINDVIDFDYIDPPPKEGIINALKMLFALGALDKNGEVTKIGRKMCEFPLEPCLSRFLVASIDNGCSKEALIICSMLSVENIFYITMENREKQEELIKKHSKYYDASGDHFTYIKIFNEFIKHNKSREWCKENGIHYRSLRMASHIRDQLESEIIKKKYNIESCHSHRSPILKSLAEGFFMNIAQRTVNDVYRTIVDINNDAARLAKLHPSSTLSNLGISPDFIIFHELNFTSKCFMKQVCEINKKDFEKLIPRAESIDINRLCGHKIIEEKDEVVKTIGKKVLHEEERKEVLTPVSSITEDKIAIAKRKYLERMNKKNK